MSEENRPVLKAKKTPPKEDNSPDKDPPQAQAKKKGKAGSNDGDIRDRLKNAYDDLIAALDNWDQGSDSSQGANKLRETLHTMHRVVSRIEIQMAYAERDSQSQKPIPTPKHRSSKKSKSD